MAKKPKTAKPKLDRAQEKARKQKRLAAVLGVFLVLVLVYEVPHTMKLMNKKAKAPVVNTSATSPAAATPSTPSASTPSTPAAAAASSTVPAASSPASTGGLIAAVQVTPDPGQLTEFQRFASKDPFLQSVQKSAGAATAGTTGGKGTTAKPAAKKKSPSVPKAPPAPPPTIAVISLNGELMSVTVGTTFPTAGATFGRVGSIFRLDALTQNTAKISIVGGSYADGAPALTLTVGKPITLQNTADGTRYTLILEPPGTQIPTTTTTTSPTSTTSSVVPTTPGG
jgi:hypothetical protein